MAKPIFFSTVTLNTDEPSKPFQIFKAGSFDFSAQGMGVVVITPADLAEFKKNFDKRVLGIDVQLNYEHGLSPAHGTKASGWIRELSLSEDGKELWATPEWTPPALEAIKNKEWRYSSAEILRAWKNPETGVVHRNVLKGAALTNVPLIKGMQAIAAHDFHNPKGGETMEFSEIVAALAKHGINLSELQGQAKLVPDLQAKVTALSEAAGKDKDRIKTLETELATTAQKLELSEKAADDVKFSALVEKGMKEGKLTKAFAEGRFTAIYKAQGLKFSEEMLADMPVVIDVSGEKGHGGAGPAGNGGNKKYDDASHELSERAAERAKTDKIDLYAATKLVLSEDKDLAKRYSAFASPG